MYIYNIYYIYIINIYYIYIINIKLVYTKYKVVFHIYVVTRQYSVYNYMHNYVCINI